MKTLSTHHFMEKKVHNVYIARKRGKTRIACIKLNCKDCRSDHIHCIPKKIHLKIHHTNSHTIKAPLEGSLGKQRLVGCGRWLENKHARVEAVWPANIWGGGEINISSS